MTTRDFTANVISASKVVPDGNYKDSKASGVWDINEALDLIKGGNWPNVANINPAAFVDALFQTHVYDGNGGTQTITNNINLSGSGGLVWIKNRETAYAPMLYDTVRGLPSLLYSSATGAADTTSGLATDTVTAFNSNGFSLGNEPAANTNGDSHVAWTFRKASKFFDIVTYTGNNTARTISHNLGSVPGMIMIKRTDSSDIWYVYHRSIGEGKRLKLNTTDAESSDTDSMDNTAPTSTVFTIGANVNHVNADGGTFVAYLFAHNDDDGGFGEPGDQDIIKCGTYTGGTTGTEVNVGFEPQFVMIKRAVGGTGDWMVFDAMRGVVNSAYPNLDNTLFWNLANVERTNTGYIGFTPTGFVHQGASGDTNTNGDTYVYMAIRRGGMQTPTAASDVFAVTIRSSSDGEGKYTSGFPVDFSLANNYDASGNTFAGTRLTNAHLQTNSNVVEGSSATDYQWDHNDGLGIGMAGGFFGGSTNNINWMWKRARGYFDVVAYTGTGSARTVTHNLGAAPEMMWMKCRSDAEDWAVYHNNIDSSAPEDYGIYLNDNAQRVDSANFWNDTAPTSSVFTVGTAGKTNGNTKTYIAMLFATIAGVSKVGSFTQSGATNVACGFSGDTPSFILLKRTDSTGDWLTFDSARGIVAGNDSSLDLNNTDAAVTNADVVDPYSGGFATTSTLTNGDYIFYAIAATS